MCNEDENKTILEGEKMKIYFEDGKLVNIKQLPIAPDYVIDASDGVTACMDMLDRIYSTNRDAVVYTNSIIAFSNRYAWNEEKKISDVYIRDGEGMEFTNIALLTIDNFGRGIISRSCILAVSSGRKEREKSWTKVE